MVACVYLRWFFGPVTVRSWGVECVPTPSKPARPSGPGWCWWGRRGRPTPPEAVEAERARLVLMAADGATNRDIGAVIGMHYNQVAVWRRRYAEFGLVGLSDGERPGRPPVYDHDDVLLLVKTVTEAPPGAG